MKNLSLPTVTIAGLIAGLETGVWAGMSLYITAKLLGIIKVQQGVDFSGVLGIYAGVTGMASTVVSFYFGSSKGSQEKSRQIDSLMSAKPANIGNIEQVDINTQKINTADLITGAKTIEQLQGYEKYVITPADRMAYDAKLSELQTT